MGARDRYQLLIFFGKHAQHHCPLKGGNSLFPCRYQLRIVRPAGSSIYKGLRAVNIFRPLAHIHRDTPGFYPVQGVRLILVGTGNAVAFAQQKLCHGAHARAANTYKVNPLYTVQYIFHCQLTFS